MKKLVVLVVTVMLVSIVQIFSEETQAQSPLKSPVVVSVDGKNITKDDIYVSMIQLFPQQAQNTLDRLVNDTLVLNEADKRKIKIKKSDLNDKLKEIGLNEDASPVVKRVIEASMLAEKMITRDNKITVTSKEIKDFFETNKKKLGQPETVKLSQIFLLSETEVDNVLLSLNAGADFGKMAKAKSQDVASKDKSGDIGVYSRGMLVPAIEKVVFEMKQGEMSQAIKTDAGFHIIKVTEKKSAKAAKYDSKMRKQIKDGLTNQKIQAAYPEWIAGLRTKAVIK